MASEETVQDVVTDAHIQLILAALPVTVEVVDNAEHLRVVLEALAAYLQVHPETSSTYTFSAILKLAAALGMYEAARQHGWQSRRERGQPETLQ